MRNDNRLPPSPFFRPSIAISVTERAASTPKGRDLQSKNLVKTEVEENKSGLLGCIGNMAVAIVGSGIVGLPFAIRQTGLVAGVLLVLFTAVLTEKSLRLIVETAKHLHKQSYETAAEVTFGALGFRFVLINMFVMSFGAMVTYLMITKTCASLILSVTDSSDQQLVLLAVSLCIQLPLACLRDMADLEKTSVSAVVIDCFIVGVVAYSSPWKEGVAEQGGWLELFRNDVVNYESIFVGLGVLSFAFECQESAFLVAGSLDNPTTRRWATVTSTTLAFCAALSLTCAVTGYLGYFDHAKGNILNSLDKGLATTLAAQTMLGKYSSNNCRFGSAHYCISLIVSFTHTQRSHTNRTFLLNKLGLTMLATYPLASFVARHVCVVLLFEGPRAHRGDDSAILDRFDRRIFLTVALYIFAMIPATILTDMGFVLALAGVIGASSLAYIGPGMLYLSVHGGRFLELSDEFFYSTDAANAQQDPSESTPLVDLTANRTAKQFGTPLKQILWYLGCFPVWSKVASIGNEMVIKYARDLASHSTRNMLRIGDVDTRSLENLAEHGANEARRLPISVAHGAVTQSSLYYTSQGQVVKKQRDQPAASSVLEADPQERPPGMSDFLIAIFYVVFGLVALVAGLMSLFAPGQEDDSRRLLTDSYSKTNN